MANEEKGHPNNLQDFCRGIPCAEMIQQMVGGEGAAAFKCGEMMSRLRETGWGSAEKRKDSSQEPGA